MITKHRLVVGLMITILVLVLGAACGPMAGDVDQVATGPGIWIDKPLPESVHPPDPIEVLSHASSPNGISAFELSVDGEVVANNEVPPENIQDTLVYLSQVWIPEGPGSYLLSVRAMDSSGAFGPSTSVRITIEEEQEAAETEEPEASPTLEPEVTEEAGACVFEAAVNLFCRMGPGSQWDDDDSMTPGMTAPVVGESEDGNYWYVLGPNTGRPCTVPKAPRFGSTTGVCQPQPQFTPPPQPTATPLPVTETPTATPTITPSPTVTPIPPPS